MITIYQLNKKEARKPDNKRMESPMTQNRPARGWKGWIDPWLDEEKLHGERRRTLLPGQDWDMEIEKAVEIVYGK